MRTLFLALSLGVRDGTLLALRCCGEIQVNSKGLAASRTTGSETLRPRPIRKSSGQRPEVARVVMLLHGAFRVLRLVGGCEAARAASACLTSTSSSDIGFPSQCAINARYAPA
jgi:hypothetical protein